MKDEMKGETRDELKDGTKGGTKDGTKDDAMLMKVLGVFVGTLVLGWILLNMLPFGYVESAVLFLAAVVAASAAWIGRKK